MNPYANYNRSLSPSLPEGGRWNVMITMLGLLFGTAASLGAIARIYQVFWADEWKTLEVKIGEAAPLLGLSIFAVAACVLLLVCVSETIAACNEVAVCQSFITIATLAMLMRVCAEHDKAWMLQWPSYLLTSCAGIAMGMVFVRLRGTVLSDRFFG